MVYIYFLLLVLIGGFFIVNLILAVINERFIEENENKVKIVEKEVNVIEKLFFEVGKANHLPEDEGDAI